MQRITAAWAEELVFDSWRIAALSLSANPTLAPLTATAKHDEGALLPAPSETAPYS